jgi:hypothetical protein
MHGTNCWLFGVLSGSRSSQQFRAQPEDHWRYVTIRDEWGITPVALWGNERRVAVDVNEGGDSRGRRENARAPRNRHTPVEVKDRATP